MALYKYFWKSLLVTLEQIEVKNRLQRVYNWPTTYLHLNQPKIDPVYLLLDQNYNSQGLLPLSPNSVRTPPLYLLTKQFLTSIPTCDCVPEMLILYVGLRPVWWVLYFFFELFFSAAVFCIDVMSVFFFRRGNALLHMLPIRVYLH